MTDPPERERIESQLRRQLRRPLVAFALIAIVFLVLFPRLGLREITFHHQLPKPGCASQLLLSAYEDEEKVRSIAHTVGHESTFTHRFSMPEGTYRLVVELRCARGKSDPIERTLILDREGSLDFDLTSQCVCGP